MAKKVVYKYPIPLDDEFVMILPRGAEILSVQAQGEAPVIWALIDEGPVPEQPRFFRLVGTGTVFEEVEGFSLVYVGTVQLRAGYLIFHLFERKLSSVTK